MDQKKIAIVGAGAVGTTTAYALMLTNTPADIILIDENTTRCAGEIMDLQDVAPLCQTPYAIRSESLAMLKTADIIIIAAGKRQDPGQSRTELVEANTTILRSILGNTGPLKSTALIIMVSNPLDILAYHAQKLSGLAHAQVFGTGTLLDTLRMRELIAQELHVHTSSIDAFILGEHGDCQFPAWSNAWINGKSLSTYNQLSPDILTSIAQKTRDKAYEIIACKGSTFYGIATCVARICHAILFDEKLTLPLSCYQPNYDVYLSMPVVLGKSGIEQTLDISLNTEELNNLKHCAQELKKLL